MHRKLARLAAGTLLAGFAIGAATIPASATPVRGPVSGSLTHNGDGSWTAAGSININKSIPVGRTTIPVVVNKSGSVTLPAFNLLKPPTP
jgi:hypothetical protein